MTKKQFREALLKLEWTQQDAADLLDVSLRTVSNYAAGDSPIPAPTAMLLRLIIDYKIDPKTISPR